jgi:hypothetical protein
LETERRDDRSDASLAIGLSGVPILFAIATIPRASLFYAFERLLPTARSLSMIAIA